MSRYVLGFLQGLNLSNAARLVCKRPVSRSQLTRFPPPPTIKRRFSINLLTDICWLSFGDGLVVTFALQASGQTEVREPDG